jgi:uncharacterized protein (DUF305 family)
MKYLATLAVAVVLLAAGVPGHAHHDDKKGHRPAVAQKHKGHGESSQRAAAPGAATKEYEAAMERMHKDMAIQYSGDADVDFARGMIPHHQAAIEMAKIVLAHGSDPRMKKLAKQIIAAQEKEIAVLNAWLKQQKK